MTPTVGIDSRDAFSSRPRGVGKTLRALLRYLPDVAPGWRFTAYTDRDGDFCPPRGIRTARITLRGDRFQAWERVRLPLAALLDRLDLLHCPGQTAPPAAPCPVVLTVHDLIPLRIDDGWSPAAVRRFRRALEGAVARATVLIAVSEHTKRDLLAEFKPPEHRVVVIPWGVELSSGTLDRTRFDILAALYQVRQPFFVAFGGEAPRKNVPRVIEAMRILANGPVDEAQLVLVGASPAAQSRFSELAESLGIGKQVRALGYLPDHDVATLLAFCEALVYPSLYEGFGLPVLEAMAVGAPVITSSTTSLPEVAGDAALLVDPTSVDAIAEAMRACYLNGALKAELARRGRRRAAAFTWERTARATVEAYRRALEREGRAS